jgi:putative transposase
MTTPRDPIYAGHRYPAEIISYAIWLYFRFPLSLRMVEEMLAARGISVTHETIRQWGLKFGREFANRIRQRTPRRGDKWHLDEVVISIAEKKHWLWRAVDRDGFVLDVLVQSRRDKKAANRLFRKLLKKQGRAPRVLVTDKLKSYAAAKREIMPGIEHRQHKGLNNRAENSHQPTRRRERIMSGSSRRGTFNASFPPMTSSPTFSPAAETTTPPPTSGPAAPGPSPRGPTSPALPWLHNHPFAGHRSAHRAFRQSVDANLTVPHEAPVPPVTQRNRSSASGPIDNYPGGTLLH